MTREEKISALTYQINTDAEKLRALVKFVFSAGISQATDEKIDQIYAALNPEPPVE